MKNLFKQVVLAIAFVTASITATAQKSYRVTAAAAVHYTRDQVLTFNQPVYFTITQTHFLFTFADGTIIKFGEADSYGFTGKLTPTVTSSNNDGRAFEAKDSAGKQVTMRTKYNYSTGTWLINVEVEGHGTMTWVFEAK